MAWYEIKGICGHTFRKQLYGKTSSRLSYVEWANNNLECPDCYKAGIEKKRQEQADKAKQEAIKENLPELEGSEKQIQWAETIRKSKIEAIRELAGKISNEDNCLTDRQKQTKQEIIDLLKNKMNQLKSKKSAKWFIDCRNTEYNRFWIEERIKEKQAKEIGKELVG